MVVVVAAAGKEEVAGVQAAARRVAAVRVWVLPPPLEAPALAARWLPLQWRWQRWARW